MALRDGLGVIAMALGDLHPIVDRDMLLVRADCPDCDAGARDPNGLWRPLVALPRNGAVRLRCDACGGGDE